MYVLGSRERVRMRERERERERERYPCSCSLLAAAGQKILDHLAKIQKMEQRVKDQEERDSATSSPAHQPSIERSDSSSSETRRRHSANRLQRQDVSVREGMCTYIENKI